MFGTAFENRMGCLIEIIVLLYFPMIKTGRSHQVNINWQSQIKPSNGLESLSFIWTQSICVIEINNKMFLFHNGKTGDLSSASSFASSANNLLTLK